MCKEKGKINTIDSSLTSLRYEFVQQNKVCG